MLARSSARRRCSDRACATVFSRAWTVRRLLVGVLLIGSAPTLIAASDRHDQPDSVALWAALEDAGVTLESGLVACERHGRPVSARFDIADGDLQLIVWIETGDRLFQAAVDPNTAEIVWAEPIKASDDLADATAQKAAMDTAKISLRSAVQQILRDNKDARAVEVTPELKDGHASALVTVLANGKFRKVSIWLD